MVTISIHSYSLSLNHKSVDVIIGEMKDNSQFKPNYFLGLRITNHTILENIEKFQNDIISSNEDIKNFAVASCKSHVTLPVLQLDKKSEDLEKCIRLLTENLKIKTQEHDNKVKFQGVGRFGSRVLFAKPVTGVSFLQSIFSLSQKILTDAGIKVENKIQYNPHLTLFKVKSGRRKRDDEFNNKIEVDIHKFDDFVFGEEKVSEVLLLSMNKEKADDGFYYKEASFPI